MVLGGQPPGRVGHRQPRFFRLTPAPAICLLHRRQQTESLTSPRRHNGSMATTRKPSHVHLRPGQPAPEVMVFNTRGELQPLSAAWSAGPVLLTFLRHFG